jgi:hypothetical protein
MDKNHEHPEIALQMLQTTDAKLLNYMNTVSITTEREQKDCEANLILAKRAYNRADEIRKDLIEPSQEAIKRVNTLFSQYLNQLQFGIKSTQTALNNWRVRQGEEANRLLDTVASDYIARVNEAKQTGEIVEPPRLPTLEQPKTSYSGPGSITYMDGFEIRIIDENKVPRDLCKPDMVRIRSRIKSGVKEIDGVLITKKFIMRTRT